MKKPKKMKTQCLNSDIISTLPDNIIEHILTLMPIQEALRTSVLSTKWRYSWRSMPKLVFTDHMVKVHSNCSCGELKKYMVIVHSNCNCGDLKKYKVMNAILHVLSLHNCPAILEFDSSVLHLDMHPDFARILSYLVRGNKVRELNLINDNRWQKALKLPVSFFSLHGLELIHLRNCTFEQPLTFEGFRRLKSLTFSDVYVSSQMFKWFLSKCPMLEHIGLTGCTRGIYVEAGGKKFTFVDLLHCVPLIKSLEISMSYMMYLSEGGMPHKLEASLFHLKHLYLEICMMEQDEISSLLFMIRSSPFLDKLKILCGESLVQQTPNNFLDPKHYSDLKLDHLETLEVEEFGNVPLEMGFVKLIMAKSPMLRKVRIELHVSFSVDEEVKMLRDLVLLQFPRASPYAKLIIHR